MNAEVNKKVEDFTADAQKAIEANTEKMTKSVEDMTSFGQQNMEAVVQSSKRAAKAAEELNAEMAAFTKKSYEDGLAAAKDMSGAKSVNELFEKQTAFMRSSTEAFVSQATRLNEMMTEATKECFEPINDRFSATTELFKTQH